MATLIVVRRDARGTFEHLQATWASKLSGDLTLMWDRRTSDRRRYAASVPVERRVGERRAAGAEVVDDEVRRGERRQHPEWRMPERRQGERRRRPPEAWGALGFLLVRSDRPATHQAQGIA
jgi:hypothetical protein